MNLKKSFFKLMVNSAFGKTMENLRKRMNVKLFNNAGDYVKFVSRPTFVSSKIFDKNFVAIHRIKSVLLLNKPIYVGFSILELSKILMYDFHYNYFKKNYNARLLLTDTDSLVYKIKGVGNVYEKIYLDKDFFDFSNYPKPLENENKDESNLSNYQKRSKFYDVFNKRVIGKIKYGR